MQVKLVTKDRTETHTYEIEPVFGVRYGSESCLNDVPLPNAYEDLVDEYVDDEDSSVRWVAFVPRGGLKYGEIIAVTSGDIYIENDRGTTTDRVR